MARTGRGRARHGAPRAGRRRMAMVTVGVMAVVVAACGGSGGSSGNTNSTTSSGGTPNPAGVLRYGEDLNNSFSGTFDPEASENDCSFAEYSQIYDSITYLPPGDQGNQVVLGGIAQSWTIQGSTLTLHIRPGVQFSDGEPVTAQAVMTSITHIRKSFLRTSLEDIGSMDPTNATTLVLQLKPPATPGDLLLAFSFIDGMVMAPNAIPTAASKPVGSGPFTLVSYSPGNEIAMKANPNYWNKAKYHLGGVDFVELSTGPQQVGALLSGSVDMTDLLPNDVPSVRGNPNIGVSITRSLQYMLMELRENTAPFNNAQVRSALEYAVDRPEINKVTMAGLGEPAYQPFPSWSAGYNPSIGQSYSYQPAKAKAMLAAAGFPNGVSFTLVFPSGVQAYEQAAELMQNEMAKAGFHVSLDQIPGGDLFTDVYEHHQGDAVLIENTTNGPDLANDFESEFESSGFVANALGSVNSQLTPLIQQASTSLSLSVQGPLMQQASKIVMSQGLLVPIVFIPQVVAYNKSRVGGTVVAPVGVCKANLQGIYIKK